MRIARKILFATALTGLACATPVLGAVIVGPSLTTPDNGYDQTGIAFKALTNSTLTSFVFQSQSKADVVTLTDLLGNVLYSQVITGGNSSNALSVNWSLVAGSSYRLLQNTANNDKYTSYGSPPPSDADIALTSTGVFHLVGDSANSYSYNDNEYWAAFNSITTSAVSSAVPEASSWVMMLVGFGCLGVATRRRQKVTAQLA